MALAFPLFTPEGERSWVPGWDPIYLHPLAPSAEAGTVFITSHGGEDTHWLILHYDPARGVAEYARFALSSRAGTVRVACSSTDDGQTRVRVSYALTALTPAGNTTLAALTPDAYHAMLAEWEAAIRASLQAEPRASNISNDR
jgi:hypothetical protein